MVPISTYHPQPVPAKRKLETAILELLDFDKPRAKFRATAQSRQHLGLAITSRR